MAEKLKYYVHIEGYILQVFKEVGETVDLTADQAREFLFEERISTEPPVTTDPDDVDADADETAA